MLALYNKHLTGSDREMETILKRSEAQFAKLDVLYEAVDATLEANMLAAEAKVYEENGTYDDLEMLYSEAAEEAGKGKTNIIRSILNALGKMLGDLGNFITGKFGQNLEAVDELPEEVEIDSGFVKIHDLIMKAWNTIKGFTNGLLSGMKNALDPFDEEGTVKPFIAALDTGVAIGVGTIVVKKKDDIKQWMNDLIKVKDDAEKLTKSGDKIVNFAKNMIGNTTPSTPENNQNQQGSDQNQQNAQNAGNGGNVEDKFLSKAKAILDFLKKICSKIGQALNWLWGKFPKLKGKHKDIENPTEAGVEKKDEKPEEEPKKDDTNKVEVVDYDDGTNQKKEREETDIEKANKDVNSNKAKQKSARTTERQKKNLKDAEFVDTDNQDTDGEFIDYEMKKGESQKAYVDRISKAQGLNDAQKKELAKAIKADKNFQETLKTKGLRAYLKPTKKPKKEEPKYDTSNIDLVVAGESASVFGFDLEQESLFYEAEMSQNVLDELNVLFEEL